MNLDRYNELKKKRGQVPLLCSDKHGWGTSIYWPLICMVYDGTLDQPIDPEVIEAAEGIMTEAEMRELILMDAELEGTSKGVWRAITNAKK